MFAHSYRKLSRTCYGESTPYALQKSSVLRWLQKQDDDDDEEKSRTRDVDGFPLPRHSQRAINVIYSSLGSPAGVHRRVESSKHRGNE